MDRQNPGAGKPARGRPRNADKRQVVQRLMDVTEEMLREINHFDLSERKIAAAAGMSEAMIHYYFGGKDGLLFALILRYYDEIAERLQALDRIEPESPHVIRDIFRILIDTYYSKPWFARIVISEFAKGTSSIKDAYMEKFGPKGLGLARLRAVFERLMARGTCRKVDAEYLARGMYSMLVAPFLLAPFAGEEFDLNSVVHDEWIDYVADLFEHQLLPPA